MERDLLFREISIGTKLENESEAPKVIWLHNTDLDAPYSGGNFNFFYNSKANEATVTLNAYISYQDNFSVTDKENFVNRLREAVAAWDKAAVVQIQNSRGEFKKDIALRFKFQPVTDRKNANKIIEVHKSVREKVVIAVAFSINTSSQIMAHELGHVWGAEDEYYASGKKGWFQMRLPAGHVGPNSPWLKDKLALMNDDMLEFRVRYFAHFGRKLLTAFWGDNNFMSPVKHNNKIVATQIIGRIALLKKDIYSNAPYNRDVPPFNPQYQHIQVAKRGNQLSKNQEFEAVNIVDNNEVWDTQKSHIERPIGSGSGTSLRSDAEVFLDPSDDRKKVSNANLKPYFWVCKIRVRYCDPNNPKSGGWSEGTGTLIGNKCVLTNAHVLLGRGKPPSHTLFDKIEVTVGLNGSDKVLGPFESKIFQVHPQFGKEKPTTSLDYDFVNSIWDYGIIKLINLSNKTMTSLGDLKFWGQNASDSKSASLIKIEKKQIYGAEGTSAGYKSQDIEMIEAKGKMNFFNNILTKYSERLFAHFIDTEHGQSGSPIWIESKTKNNFITPILVGIHVFGNSKVNAGITITDEVLKEIGEMKVRINKSLSPPPKIKKR